MNRYSLGFVISLFAFSSLANEWEPKTHCYFDLHMFDGSFQRTHVEIPFVDLGDGRFTASSDVTLPGGYGAIVNLTFVPEPLFSDFPLLGGIVYFRMNSEMRGIHSVDSNEITVWKDDLERLRTKLDLLKRLPSVDFSIMDTSHFTTAMEIGYGTEIFRAYRDGKIPNTVWTMTGSCYVMKKAEKN